MDARTTAMSEMGMMRGWTLRRRICVERGRRWAVAAVLGTAAIAVMVGQAAALNTAFTYQGQIVKNGTPVDGPCDFQFSLFDAATAGTKIGATQTLTNVTATNGAISVQLNASSAGQPSGSFGSLAFTGNDRWLEIATRCPPGAGTYTTLAPRQQVTAVPYAAFAAAAGSLTCTGCIDSATMIGTNTIGTVQIQDHSIGKDDIAVSVFAGNGTAVTAARSDHDHVGDSWSGAPISIFSGIPVPGPVLSLSNTGSGSGLSVKSTDGIGALFVGAKAGAKIEGATNDIPDLILGGNGSASNQDDGTISSDPAYSGSDLYLDANDAVVIKLDQDNTETGQLEVVNGGTGDIIFSVDEASGTRATSNGIGLAAPALAAENFNTDAAEPAGIAIYGLNHGDDATIVAKNTGTGDYFRALNGTNQIPFRVTQTGRVVTSAVQITGGGDLAEKFEVTGAAAVEPGTLLVIDDAKPGALTTTDRAYDTRVAGVVSGAGGVRPGLMLVQDGVLDGEATVAITGRVYVKANDLGGPIEPGDLLTTSSRPGHAMKAHDLQRRSGAVVGKAMSRLEHGSGLVLVMVNLQ